MVSRKEGEVLIIILESADELRATDFYLKMRDAPENRIILNLGAVPSIDVEDAHHLKAAVHGAGLKTIALAGVIREMMAVMNSTDTTCLIGKRNIYLDWTVALTGLK